MEQVNSQLITCSICLLRGHRQVMLSASDYVKHIRLFHEYSPTFQFTCGINGCPRSYHNVGTFKNHVSEAHGSNDVGSNSTAYPDVPSEPQNSSSTSDAALVNALEDTESSNDDDEYCGEDTTEVICTDLPHCSSKDTLQKSSAMFLLGLKEKFKLTQAATQEMVEGVTNLFQKHISILRSQVCATLDESGLSSQVKGLEKFFEECEHPFMGLENQYQQLQYMKANLNFIEPVCILLGQRHIWKGTGVKRRCINKEDHVIYVPILKTLQSLLKNQVVLSEIQNGHKSSDEIMSDFCDGETYAAHPLFTVHKDALQIFFYFDELELCNPLGSKSKIHKLGTFYFSLGNLSPKYRSRLTSIHLVALVKSSFIGAYGIDAILKPFADDMKKLEDGVEFLINGKKKTMFGTIAAISADNLGSLLLGGFKESCSALKLCRHCMTTKKESQKWFSEKHFQLRNKSTHQEHCRRIQEDTTGALSKEYRVNRNSVLNQLRFFHVCDGSLLPDIMHDVLEGTLQYEAKLMLQVMVNKEEYFTLEELNSRIENFELGYMESKNRPTAISSTTLFLNGNSLKQNASQMNLFGHILPLLIGDLVPDDDECYELFLKLMDITDILFSPTTSDDYSAYLATLIREHHHEFCRVYPDHNIIPKMHFMVHTPRLMTQYGPLVCHWTMRYEAKHSYFKRLAQSIGNFINIPFTLGMRHQQYQCYLNVNTEVLPGWSNNLEVGKGSVVSNTTIAAHSELVSTVFRTRWVKVDGNLYKPDTGVIIGVEDDLPVVGKIQDIYIIDSNKVLFSIKQFYTFYESHYHAYTFRNDTDIITKFVSYEQLFLQSPVHIRKSQTLHTFIILPHVLCTL